MKISFHGAAKTVTGSKHIITLDNGQKILLDCGMFQGLGQEGDDLNANFGFDPKSIHVLLLTHAHIDHSGLIPKLIKEGFQGKIICTEATRDLTEILLFDSAEIQTYETELIDKKRKAINLPIYEPLYDSADVHESLQQFQTIETNVWVSVTDEVKVRFASTGHLIGSAAITLKIRETGKKPITILYTGDIGRFRSPILQAPVIPEAVDYIIIESTYADKHHDITFNTIETISEWIKKICVQRQGKLIIPAFSVGRSQEVLYALNQLSLENRLPEGLLVFVDSPLSQKATETIKKYTDLFNERLQKVLLVDDDPFDFPGLKYIETVEDSRRLVEYKEPCVIISASGTADAGRVRHHINSCISNKDCGILLVGYCSGKSLGGQLINGNKQVEIFSDMLPVYAEIGQVQGMSAHGDINDLMQFMSNQNPEKLKGIFLVHGEPDVQKKFTEKLATKGFRRIECPALHQEYTLPLPPVRKRKRIPFKTTETIILKDDKNATMDNAVAS